jgi:hypothetical protein
VLRPICTNLRNFSRISRLHRQTLKTSGYVQPSVAKDKPAGNGLTKPICLSFSLLPAGLIALARRFERLAARAKNFAQWLKLVHIGHGMLCPYMTHPQNSSLL